MKKPGYGWFGAGWASCKEGAVANNHMPPDEDNVLSEWLNGFFAAFAEYPDDEAMQGILQGDYTRGEQAEDALLRIAPKIYISVSENSKLKQKFRLKV